MAERSLSYAKIVQIRVVWNKMHDFYINNGNYILFDPKFIGNNIADGPNNL